MGRGTVTDMMMASTGMKTMMQATQPPIAADTTLSCPEITTRLGNLYARYEEIDRRQRERRTTMGEYIGLDVSLRKRLPFRQGAPASGPGAASACPTRSCSPT